MPKSEEEKLLEDTNKQEEDVMNAPLVPEVKGQAEVQTPQSNDDDEEETPKRRREKRLMDKLQSEREANIALSSRLEALSEAQKLREDTADDYLKKVEKIYGTDSPEAQAATNLLAEALKGVEEKAYDRAVTSFREEQRQAQEALQKEEQTLDSYVEELEDTYNVTFTPEMEKAYFQLMEKLSPKDSEGKILAYADPHSTWEIFQEKLQSRKPDTRQKDLASRSMVNSGTSDDTKIQDDAARRLLKEAGII